MKFLLFVPLTILLASCSGGKSAPEGEDVGIELADAVEFTEDSGDVFAEELPEAMPEEMPVALEEPVADPLAAPMEEPMAESMGQDPMMAEAPVQIDPVQSSPVAMSGESATYTVKENETLMMIAFNIYGDYAKWREIAARNQDKLQGSTTVTAGMQLSYDAPAQPFTFSPSGNPYLIVKGDTLGLISQKTYGRHRFWKDIWDNNRPLIKDPNIIFAGFTIYTPVIEGRDVAFDGL